MGKYLTAIILAFLAVETICETSCPLGDLNQDLIESVTKLNGTWSDYQKTSEFLTNATCFTYDFKCLNDTNCEVDLVAIKKGDDKKETNQLSKTDSDINIWGTEQIYINVDPESKYAILWNCEETEKDTETRYQLAVLMRNVTDETIIKKIQDKFTDIKVTYKSEVKIIDYDACSDATVFTISIAVALIVVFSSFL